MPVRTKARSGAARLHTARRIGTAGAPTWTLCAALSISALHACRDQNVITEVTSGDAGTDDGTDASDASATSSPSSIKTLFQTLLADVQTQPSEQQPFIRYVGLSQRRLAAVSEAELGIERAALILALNSLSLVTRLTRPVAIDAAATLYRIDLRDYAWEREVAVEGPVVLPPLGAPPLLDAGPPHADAWAAISANNPYAVQLTGSDADELARLTQSPVPFAEAETLLDTALNGYVYYALTGAPSNLGAAREIWGGTFEDELDAVKVGTAESGVHRAPDEGLILERYEMLEARLPLWLALACWLGGGDTLFDEAPDVVAVGESFAAFSLPNGLLGYATYEDAWSLSVTSASPEGRNASVCFSCHVQGPIAMLDQVRPYVEANPDYFELNYPSGYVEAILTSYLPQPALDALFASEQDAYRAKLTQLGIPDDLGADVISTTLARFERPLNLAGAAAELGVSPEQLSASHALQLPELAGLAAGLEVPRSDFSRVYEDALCNLFAENADELLAPATCQIR